MIAGESGNQLDTIQMDFTARRFDTFSEEFTIEYYDDDQALQEVDLTGATAQMQLKKKKSDASPFFSFDVAISGNTITISKNHTKMDLPAGKYWHDIEIKDADGNHITWIQGRFVVVEHVTHYVDTYLTYFVSIIKSVLSIIDVPKISYGLQFITTLLLKSVVVYRFKSIFVSVLKFVTINFIVKKVIAVFSSVIDIKTVPKTIYQVIFGLIVRIENYVIYYGTSRFEIKVTFTESD